MEPKLKLAQDERQLLDSLRKVDTYLPSVESLVEIAEITGLAFILRCVASHLEHERRRERLV